MRIKVERNGEVAQDFGFQGDVIKIGRLKNSVVILDHDDVARMHAVIEQSDRGWKIIDLGSRTGVSVNGVTIDKNAIVDAGDEIGIGPFMLRLDIEVNDETPEEPTVVRFEADGREFRLVLRPGSEMMEMMDGYDALRAPRWSPSEEGMPAVAAAVRVVVRDHYSLSVAIHAAIEQSDNGGGSASDAIQDMLATLRGALEK